MVNILPGGSIEGLLYSVYCTVYSTVPIWYLLLEQTLGFRRARIFSCKTNLSSGKSLAQEFDQVAENRKVANPKFETNLESLMKNLGLYSEQSEIRGSNNTLQVANLHNKTKWIN